MITLNSLSSRQRLQLGTAVVGILILLYGLDWIYQQRQQLEQSYQQQQRLQQSQLAVANQSDIWQQRLEQADSALTQYRALFWRAESAGIAQATLQSRIQQQLAQLQLQRSQYNSEVSPLQIEGIAGWQVTISLSASLSMAQLIELLYFLEQNRQPLQIKRLDIQGTGSNNRYLQLDIVALVLQAVPDKSSGVNP
ncbi:hypothetical protein D5085_10980 [Ectothiorhodospiraceae bacterium BW-2]|nr:hypothetical protein D5085_10980 [Ectothiorhodospiraceae bacterium BW-2]